MPKKFQDVVKIKKINRDVAPIHLARREEAEPPQVLKKERAVYPPIRDTDGGSRYALWFVALVSVVFLMFALSFLFSGATVQVNPKSVQANLEQKFTASKDPSAALPFDLVVLAGEETKTIKGGEEKEVTEKAKGRAILYNTTSAAQKLLIDTRLEGSNGKMYKTDTATTIPAASGTTPGQVEIGIYADIAGAEGNAAALDFKIFGFKDSAKYTKFYGRSVGDLKGGFVGKMRQVSEEEKLAAFSELKQSLQTKLIQKAGDQTPAGFILYKDAVFLRIDSETADLASQEENVPVTVKGTLYGFLLDEKKLTNKIADTALSAAEKQSEVYIPNIRDLIFALDNKESVSFSEVKDISFSLTGPVKIVSRIDEEKIKKDLLGKRKKDFNKIFSEYTDVESAVPIVRPAWKLSFPEKLKDIKVIVNYPN